MTAPNTFGSELGTGLGAFAQQQYQQATLRSTDFQTVVRPAYNTEWQSLGEVLKSYGAQTDKGLPNPNYDPARLAHARDRLKQLMGLMRNVNLNTQDDAGYQPAKQALLSFLGVPDGGSGTALTSPASAAPASGPAPVPAAPILQAVAPHAVPPPMDYTFAPSSNPMGVQASPAAAAPAAPSDPAPQGTPASGQQATPAPAQVAPTSTPVAPLPATLRTYNRVQDVPIDQLLTADDASLVGQFGEGADEYARSARGVYKAKQDEAQTAAIAAQNKLWDTKLTAILTDTTNPASPKQVGSTTLITGLNSKKATGYQLTPAEDAQYRQAIVDLAPDVYSLKAWQDVLNSKDNTQITAMYKVFRNVAPGVIPASFDITPYQTQLDDAHRTATATALRETTQNDAAAQATRIQLALGGSASIGEAISKKDTITLRRVAADPDALKLLGYKDGTLLLDAATEIDRGVKAGTDKVVNDGTGVAQDNTLKLLLGGATSIGEVISKKDGLTLRRVAADPAALKLLGYADGQQLLDAATEIERGVRAGTDKVVTDTASVADTDKIKTLLGGSGRVADVISKGDSATLRRIAADPAGLKFLGYTDGGQALIAAANQIDRQKTATTNKTLAEMLGANAASGAKLLAQLSVYPPTMTYDQIAKGSGGDKGIVANLKRLLGVNDNGAANLIQQVQYQFGLGLRGKELLNKLTLARIDTQTAMTDNYNASASQTTALTPVKVGEGTARTNLAVAQTGTANANTGQITQLTPVKVGEGQARTDQINSTIIDNRNRANAYVDGVRKGTLPLDAAHIAVDQQKLSILNAQLDKQMQIVAHRSASADQVILDGLKNAPPPTAPGSVPGSVASAVAPAGFRAQSDGVAKRIGVNPQHLYGFFGAESSFGQNTANYKGMDYAGPGQIGAAAQSDVNRIFGLNLDRNNPDQNMEIAARYYKLLSQKYGNDPQKIYAAYNMGGGNLEAHLKANGGKLNISALPTETQTGLGNLLASMRGYVQDKPKTTLTPAPKATPITTTAALPAAPRPTAAAPVTSSAVRKWGPPTAALPSGMKLVGSVTQYAQDLRQRGWFGAVAGLKAGDTAGLQRLVQQATLWTLPNGTAEQRLAMQRDLWDSVNN